MRNVKRRDPGARVLAFRFVRPLGAARKYQLAFSDFSFVCQNAGEIVARDRIIGSEFDDAAKDFFSCGILAAVGINLGKVYLDTRADSPCCQCAFVKCLVVAPVTAANCAANAQGNNRHCGDTR